MDEESASLSAIAIGSFVSGHHFISTNNKQQAQKALTKQHPILVDYQTLTTAKHKLDDLHDKPAINDLYQNLETQIQEIQHENPVITNQYDQLHTTPDMGIIGAGIIAGGLIMAATNLIYRAAKTPDVLEKKTADQQTTTPTHQKQYTHPQY